MQPGPAVQRRCRLQPVQRCPVSLAQKIQIFLLGRCRLNASPDTALALSAARGQESGGRAAAAGGRGQGRAGQSFRPLQRQTVQYPEKVDRVRQALAAIHSRRAIRIRDHDEGCKNNTGRAGASAGSLYRAYDMSYQPGGKPAGRREERSVAFIFPRGGRQVRRLQPRPTGQSRGDRPSSRFDGAQPAAVHVENGPGWAPRGPHPHAHPAPPSAPAALRRRQLSGALAGRPPPLDGFSGCPDQEVCSCRSRTSQPLAWCSRR